MIAYKITNTENGKLYIGITKGVLRRRLAAHFNIASKNADNIAFYNAIRKYGKSVFVAEQIAEAKTIKELCELEKQLIIKFNSKLPNGYNTNDGGFGMTGYKKTPEQRAIQSEKMKLYHANVDPAIKAAKNKAISDAKKGVPNMKLRGRVGANKGCVRTDEFKANASVKQQAFALANREEMARRGSIKKSSVRR